MSNAPLPSAAPGGEFFQLGYVARDLDRALALFANRYGVEKFQHYMSRADMDVALAYRGDVMIEIIVAHDPADALYGAAMAQGEVVLHHLGYLVDAEEWARLPEALEAMKIPVTRRSRPGSPVSFLYADTRADLGHFSEYVYLPKRDEPYFAGVPHN